MPINLNSFDAVKNNLPAVWCVLYFPMLFSRSGASFNGRCDPHTHVYAAAIILSHECPSEPFLEMFAALSLVCVNHTCMCSRTQVLRASLVQMASWCDACVRHENFTQLLYP